MTSIPAEFYALANAFLFALHNYVHQKSAALLQSRHRGDQQSFDQHHFSLGRVDLVRAVVIADERFDLIFVVVGFFQPGLTRLLSYKGIDALGVAITDPIRATTPLFSAAMAIMFLGEKITLPIIVATLMIIAGITLFPGAAVR